MPGRVRAYLAASLDGYIAGENDELDWLGASGPAPDSELPDGVLGFEAFMAQVGAMVMGRRTYDVVATMDGAPWPYGDIPVLVATHRPLEGARPTVRAVEGDIAGILDRAIALAGDKDVYVDGGETLRAALDGGRVDEVVLSVVPVLLGKGRPLFAGLEGRKRVEIASHLDMGPAMPGMVQLRLRFPK
ncbi:bifunctional deaminase-reductase domain-containing protein [Hyaloraphidium curvatum]|nr:bifunctional deaminase-reductase domain-containing protein [Hyaloraphidium curvatum]